MSTTPRILIVAAGNPDLSDAQQDTLRPLIPYTKDALTAMGYFPSYAPYAVAPLGPGTSTNALETKIANLLDPKPDMILTIASAATKAAKRVVKNNDSAQGIPIVFTVVSLPEVESANPNNAAPDPADPICPPPPRAERITGVSRKLVGTARGAVERFAACLNNNCNIHWCCRPKLHQAMEAERLIEAPPPLQGVKWSPHYMQATDCAPFLHTITDPGQIPPNVPLPMGGTLTGLFLIPDDLIGSCAHDIISTAQSPSRRIPVFVQQLEYVCPEFNHGNQAGPFAMGGYGVSPKWIGDNAAILIDEILQNGPDHPKNVPVKFPDRTDLLFRINPAVVKQLDIGITVPSGVQVCS